tara:strand:- start:280 stop:444 length:165 start_codon:yes stop_codon:yes gene_type:complete
MQIIISMSGFGKRFLEAGYEVPNPYKQWVFLSQLLSGISCPFKAYSRNQNLLTP